MVLVSVRYRPDGRTVEYARGYARQGSVWSDLRLFSREQVVQLIRSGARVAAGKDARLEGDFEVTGWIRLVAHKDSGALLAIDGRRSDRDDLELPLF